MRLLVGLIVLALSPLTTSSAFAGCEHTASARQVQLGDSLEPSLLGKWQYVAGQTYYLFHPMPTPCDGPKCRQAPEPSNEMTSLPTTGPRTVPVIDFADPPGASQQASGPLVCPSTSWPCAPDLCGLLRPPQFA